MSQTILRPDLGILDDVIRKDLERSTSSAVQRGAVFQGPASTEELFATAVRNAITSIEARGDRLKRFLELGPYEGDGSIPAHLEGSRLSDEETTAAVAFIYCHIVNSFQGALTELLATGPITALVESHIANRVLPTGSRVFFGDSVLIKGADNTLKKGADAHVFAPAATPSTMKLVGVVEIKSYHCPYARVLRQLKTHAARARRDLTFVGIETPEGHTIHDNALAQQLVSVFPSAWHLPREFWFEEVDGKKLLRTPTMCPPQDAGRTEQIDSNEWRIALSWSREAIASAAYELTYWYMGELGADIYRDNRPEYLKSMSLREAGHNSAKMMLYYAINRCRTTREWQRAIALYNAYGFGYALGMNFRDKSGKRQMLWPEDLHEIKANGFTKHGDSLW